MNKIFIETLIVVVLSISGNTYAQYFNKVYDFDKGLEYSLNILEINNNYFINTGGSDSLWNEKFGYLVLDSLGRVIHKKEYSIPKASIRNGKLIALKDGNLADFRTYQYRDSINTFRSNALFIILNNVGDTLWTKRYEDSTVTNFYASTLIETSDSGFLLICQRNRAPDYDPIVIRTDKNGKELWRKTIDTPGDEKLYSIVRHPNGDYYLGGGGNTGGVGRSWVVRMTDSAKVIFSKRYKMTRGLMAVLSVLKDSNLIFGSDTFIYKSTYDYTRKQIIKIEPENGDVLWTQIHDTVMQLVGYNKILEGDSNELYVMGSHTNDDIWTSYTLTRLTPEGDTVWMHNYMYEQVTDENLLWDFIRTNDGGFVFCGDVVPNGSNQDVWVLKVDSNGCMTPECKSRVYDIRLGIGKTKTLGIKIKVYPNPVVNELQIEFEKKKQTAWQYDLINSAGKTVKTGKLAAAQNNNITVKELAKGVYLLQLESEEGYRVFRVVKD